MRYGTRAIEPDGFFIGSIALLLVIGTAILGSVEPRLFPLQWVYLVGGILIFWLITRADRIVLESVTPVFYGVVVLALVGTLILGGVTSGAVRWLTLGPLTIQPSEFAKPAVVLMTAWATTRNLKYKFLVSLFVAILVSGLVFIQPDLGTTIILFAAWFGAVLGGGVAFKTILRFCLIGAFALPVIWFLLAPYQKERILSYIWPSDLQGASYQGFQAMIAAGSGGLFGRGLGQGSQTQLSFLPEHHTDFVFASIGEELGFFGMTLVVIAFFILFWRIAGAFDSTKNQFAKSVISGIFLYLFAQTFINIGMNLGMLPIAGVPLPLVSAGGSALISTMFTLGLVLGLRKL